MLQRLPNGIKQINNLRLFSKKVKTWLLAIGRIIFSCLDYLLIFQWILSVVHCHQFCYTESFLYYVPMSYFQFILSLCNLFTYFNNYEIFQLTLQQPRNIYLSILEESSYFLVIMYIICFYRQPSSNLFSCKYYFYYILRKDGNKCILLLPLMCTIEDKQY